MSRKDKVTRTGDEVSSVSAKKSDFGDGVSLERGRRLSEGEKGVAALMAASGASAHQISVKLGVSERTAYRLMHSEVASSMRSRVLASTVQDARAVLAANAARAAERVVELVESDRDDTALRAAGSVLDRVGVVQQQHVAILTSTPDEELRQEYLAAVELLRSRGEL